MKLVNFLREYFIQYESDFAKPSIPKNCIEAFKCSLLDIEGVPIASLQGFAFQPRNCDAHSWSMDLLYDVNFYMYLSYYAIFSLNDFCRFGDGRLKFYVIESLASDSDLPARLLKLFVKSALEHYAGSDDDRIAMVAPGCTYRRNLRNLIGKKPEALFWKDLGFKKLSMEDRAGHGMLRANWLYYWPLELAHPIRARQTIKDNSLRQHT